MNAPYIEQNVEQWNDMWEPVHAGYIKHWPGQHCSSQAPGFLNHRVTHCSTRYAAFKVPSRARPHIWRLHYNVYHGPSSRIRVQQVWLCATITDHSHCYQSTGVSIETANHLDLQQKGGLSPSHPLPSTSQVWKGSWSDLPLRSNALPLHTKVPFIFKWPLIKTRH